MTFLTDAPSSLAGNNLMLPYLSNGVNSFLKINAPKVTLDIYASKALEATEKEYTKQYTDARNAVQAAVENLIDNLTQSTAQTAAQDITQHVDLIDYISALGNSQTIANLSSRINGDALNEISRLLLSNPIIYSGLIKKAIDSNVQPNDEEGLYSSIMRSVMEHPRNYFLAMMVVEYLNDKRIRLNPQDKRWERISSLTKIKGLPIATGEVEPAINAILSTIYTEGNLPYYLGQYIQSRSAISASAFNSKIYQGMIDYLVKLGVQIKSDEEFNQGVYDEYFLLAYNEAIKLSSVTEDPIDTARIKGGEIFWDFSVENFDSVEAQGIIPTNVLAAGVLDYIYCIGEQMRVYDIANSLVLRWASGSLDVTEGKTASLLYRFHKLREERSTPEERAMLYKRVLNKGNGRLLSNMIANQDFPRLWHKLMLEATEYIRKSEGRNWYGGEVSRTPIEQATKNIQYNLTDFMTGMSHLQVTEDYAHLQEAIQILQAPEILSEFGGRRKSMWTVIEKVGKEDLGVSIPTILLRTCAVEGNKIFNWIANFNKYGGAQDNEFSSFIEAAEAWIIAQASMESDEGMDYNDDEEDDDFADRFLNNPNSLFNGNGSNGSSSDGDDFDDWDW